MKKNILLAVAALSFAGAAYAADTATTAPAKEEVKPAVESQKPAEMNKPAAPKASHAKHGKKKAEKTGG